jgi:hypothetical protein
VSGCIALLRNADKCLLNFGDLAGHKRLVYFGVLFFLLRDILPEKSELFVLEVGKQRLLSFVSRVFQFPFMLLD